MRVVPFTSDPARRFSTSLGDVKVELETRWNDSTGLWGDGYGGFWTLDIIRNSVVLEAGIPIAIGQDILAPYALGLGGLVPADMSGLGLDAGADDLGTRVVVMWLSEDELAAVRAA